jgi:HSP20 family protein
MTESAKTKNNSIKEDNPMLLTDIGRLGRILDPWRESATRPLLRAAPLAAIDFPAVNISLSGDNAVVMTELPGLDADSLEVSVTNNLLTLRGSRKPEELSEGDSYHRQERWHGTFTKTVELPFAIEADKVDAKFAKGVLSIVLPRAEADKPKKINVSTDGGK